MSERLGEARDTLCAAISAVAARGKGYCPLSSARSIYNACRSLKGVVRTADMLSESSGYPPHVPDELYNRFTIPKRGGGSRHIITVNTENRWSSVLLSAHSNVDKVLSVIEPHPAVFSYKRKTSIADCASHHTGKRVLVAIDLKDYFYSITASVVEQFTAALIMSFDTLMHNYFTQALETYGEEMPSESYEETKSNLMQDIGTHTMEETAIRSARAVAIVSTARSPYTDTYAVPIGVRPSSRIANLVLYPLDEKLHTYAAAHEISYTRYCDNLYFSSHGYIPSEFIDNIVGMVEGFDLFGKFLTVNRKKTRVVPYYRRQRMLGIVVNSHTNIPLEKRKRLRSAINHLFHDIMEKGSLDKKLRSRYREVMGELSFLKVVNKAAYDRYATARLALQVARAIADEQTRTGGER